MSLVSQFIAACGETGEIVQNELNMGGQKYDLMASPTAAPTAAPIPGIGQP